MLMEMTVHPGADELLAFGQGRLTGDDMAAIEEHVSACDTCCDVLEQTACDSFVGRLQQARQVPAAPTGFDAASAARVAEGEPAAGDVPTELSRHPRYRVLRLLGQGGMGAVFLAEHRQMGRAVALKVISPRLLRHPGALARFQQEVRTAARLDHPNIVAAFDADQADGLHFLVMEYVEGQNLADYLVARGPLPIHEAADIARQAALGLQHAHEGGMVHRDIKPHNLVRAGSGRVKVLDFGLALLEDESTNTEEPASGSAPSSHLPDPSSFAVTEAGAVVGPDDYIAPEQVRDAHAADGRADLYSLGCTLYQLLAGRPPFPEGTTPEKLRRHGAEEPRRLRALRPEVPEGLARVVAKMMAKQPEERYQTGADVAAALAPYARGPARKPSKPRRTLLVLAGLAAVLGSLAAAGIVRLPSGPEREIVIETNDPTIEVIVQGDRIVRIVDPKTGKAYRLDRSDLTLSADDPDGLSVVLDGERPITIKRQGKQVATVRLEHAPAVPNGDFRMPIFPPLREGQALPACQERPSETQVLRALPKLEGGTRTDVRIEYEKIVDKIDPPRIYPVVGYARMHHCHWKCTVHFTEVPASSGAVPGKVNKARTEVVYIDKDHVHQHSGQDDAQQPPGAARQVRLAMTVAKVQAGPTRQLFSRWIDKQGKPQERVLGDHDELAKEIEALRKKGLAQILTSPVVITVSGKPARVLSGFRVPLCVTRSTSGGTNIAYKDVGVAVIVVPTVLAEGKIHLEIRPEISQVDPRPEHGKESKAAIPSFRTQEARVTVDMKPGQTAVLANLFPGNTTVTVFAGPGSGETPAMKAGDQPKEEYLILITPRLVHPEDAPMPQDDEVRIAPKLGDGPGHIDPPKPPIRSVPTVTTPRLIRPNDILSIFINGLADTEAKQRLNGEHMVRGDGTLSLGSYGSVRVADLTTTEARSLIAKHLAATLAVPPATVGVSLYSVRWCYVIFAQGASEQVFRVRMSGGETVLDALTAAGWVPASGSNAKVWVTRTPADGSGPEQILQVDYPRIVRDANSATNYHLRPGDRVFVAGTR